ncbi:hypothetical protein D3C71_2090060 [compost metagenome]
MSAPPIARSCPSRASAAKPVAAASMLANTGMPSALICSMASAGPWLMIISRRSGWLARTCASASR